MKSRETLVRLKRFQVDEKRRRVAQIETMIAEFERMASDLDREIAAEEQKAGISDPGHFAYPTYAKAAAQRRSNLRRSATDLQGQLDEAKGELAEAFEELKKVEILEDRERAADRAIETSRDQAAMNQIGLSRVARRRFSST
jgi:flagellar protein FliJ